MLLQAAANHPFPSLAYFDFVQCVSSQHFYILIPFYFYSSASTCSKAGVCVYIHMCVSTHVYTFLTDLFI